MVRPSHLLSLAATAFTALAAGEVVPGAFIFEFVGGYNTTALKKAMGSKGNVRVEFEFDRLNGFSFQFHDIKNAAKMAAKLAAENAALLWHLPVTLHQSADPTTEWARNESKERMRPRKRALSNTTLDTYSPHVMTQIDKLRAKGYTGKGVRIAILDSGIDYTHSALGRCFGPRCLVSFGTDFVGDDYNGKNSPKPDDDPMDNCDGHGTHVAGIIAAKPNKFGFTGVVPDATLGAYRILGCKGHVTSDVVIAAVNQALKDKADIINLSRIVEQGVPIIVAAGNMGRMGLFAPSLPADAKGVISVATIDNAVTPIFLFQAKYTVDGADDVEFGYIPGIPSAWNGASLDVYAASVDTAAVDGGCGKLLSDETPDLTNMVVVLRSAEACNLLTWATNAKAKGARYILTYPASGGMDSILPPQDALPGIVASGTVSKEMAETWIEAVKSGKRVTLTMPSPGRSNIYKTTIPNDATGGALRLSTSWGPTWGMDMKPQIGGPGGNILSTTSMANGGYEIWSGSSMACPIVTGIVALVAQVRHTFDPVLINNLLSSTAKPRLFNDGTRFHDYYAPTAQQGAGLVQAYDAAFATTLLEPSALSFNDTDHFVESLNITISNTGNTSVTYQLSNVPAITMYAFDREANELARFPNEAVRAAAGMRFSQDLITLGPGSSASVQVQPTPPSGLDAKRLAFWSGWIAVNGTGAPSLSIPYQGLTGSLHNTTVLKPRNVWVACSNDTEYVGVKANVTFTLPNSDDMNTSSTAVLPAIVARLTLGSLRLKAHVLPVTSLPEDQPADRWRHQTIGEPFGFPVEYTSRKFLPYRWDGKLESGEYAPEGQYTVVVRALRIFGNANRTADWDVGETLPFHIRYRGNQSAHGGAEQNASYLDDKQAASSRRLRI
ncbi:hypothetical protein DCS_01914 [Drechmeria coniospora]|uniref:Subtilisin-like serine protease PR1C n=1 Tax=Drechmeria coniospora TaxID=98403 RepID=A0A151GUI5_DRECN|nr:hypothetical protein DCS_01914 [Drechmeria coniospora]KYK60776.1 hypothetical protein DCS_01914 [Drechmeria coniospora]